MEIKTKRLILRPLKLSDAKSITENINNLNITKWLLVVPYPYKIKDAKNWINKTILDYGKKKKENYLFGIELKEEKKIIGAMGLHKVNGHSADLGYWLGEKYWRKGYGSEALKEVLEFGFNKLKLNKLEAGIFAGNPSSGKLLEKFGFEKEGYRRKTKVCKADGKVKDEVLYGLLKEDWKKK